MMKNKFESIKSDLKNAEDIALFDNFITKFASREERHYCAYLFSWLISSPNAIKDFFTNHSLAEQCNFSSSDCDKVKIYYEYTGLRELIHLMNFKIKNKGMERNMLKSEIEASIFDSGVGDIQKKKPDLTFYFPESKSLVLVEAKFEMNFDIPQIEESKKYGDVLKELFPNEIKKVIVTTLGVEYFIAKTKSTWPSLSWEVLSELLPNGKVKEEIILGLNYQKIIHPIAMKEWSRKLI